METKAAHPRREGKCRPRRDLARLDRLGRRVGERDVVQSACSVSALDSSRDGEQTSVLTLPIDHVLRGIETEEHQTRSDSKDKEDKGIKDKDQASEQD